MATASTTQQQIYTATVSNTKLLSAEDASVSVNIATTNQTNSFLDSALTVQNQVQQSISNAALTAKDVQTTAGNVAATAAQVALANQARLAAETARDSAILSSKVYPDTASGLANTAQGGYFTTISPNNTEYLSLYRDDGAVATPIQTYPSVAGIEYTTANTLYVKANGDDTRDGGSWKNAFKTIEHALAVATAAGTPTLIEWGPQSAYYTNGHLDMPDNCVIKAIHRTVFVRPNPGYEQRNVFRMGSGCFLEGVMFEGWQVDDFDNPTEGFAVSFRPGAVITRVPYAHKIAVRALPTWTKIAPPLDAANGNPLVPRAGGVVLADGSIISQYSIFPNIMTWGATPVLPNGIGYCAKNGALINAVNAVSIWAHKHFMAIQGGQLILSGCSTQFGDYTMYADGTRSIISPQPSVTSLYADSTTVFSAAMYSYPTVYTNQIQQSDITLISNNLLQYLINTGYATNWNDTLKQKTLSDSRLLMQCINWVLQSANEQPMLDFAKGLFDTTGHPIYIPITKSVTPVTDTYKNAVPYIKAQETTIVDATWNHLVASGYVSTWTATDQAYTKRDTLTLLKAIEYTLFSGNEQFMIDFAKGLFYANGNLVISSEKFSATIAAFDYIQGCLTENNAIEPGVGIILQDYSIYCYSLDNTLTNFKNYASFIKSLFAALITTLNRIGPAVVDESGIANFYFSDAIIQNKDTIINNMWNAIVAAGYTTTVLTADDEAKTRRDANTLLTAIINSVNAYDINTRNYVSRFATLLFDQNGQTVFSDAKLPVVIFSFNNIRNALLNLPFTPPSYAATQYAKPVAGINALFDSLIAALTQQPYINTGVPLDYIDPGYFIRNKQATIDSMWQALVTNKYVTNWTADDQAKTRRDADTVLTAMYNAVNYRDRSYLQNLTSKFYSSRNRSVITQDKMEATLFAINYLGTKVKDNYSIDNSPNFYRPGINLQPGYDFIDGIVNEVVINVAQYTSKLAPYIASFKYVRDSVINLPNFNATNLYKFDRTKGPAVVTTIIATLISNITNPTVIQDPSRITAIGHTWTSVLGGVALTKIPPANNKGNIQDSIYEGNNAIVIASGQDDQGNALFVGGLQISADTGELGGAPFDQAVRRVATRAAISGSY